MNFIFFTLFVVCILIRISFSLVYFRKLLLPFDHIKSFSSPVSILICARDEAIELDKNLMSIINQKFTEFEIIVVNHFSTDNTKEVVQKFQNLYKNIKYHFVQETNGALVGKKYALYEGFRVASHPIIVTIDADCTPASDHWLERIVAPFADHRIDIVIGYSPYVFTTQHWLTRSIISIDQIQAALMYLSMAKSKMAYMGVGRNMAFRKEIITEDYWSKYSNIGYADDDFIVQNFATKDNVAVVLDEDSQVLTNAKKSIKEFIVQKLRHVSAGSHYLLKIVFLLGLHQFINLLSIILFFYIIFGLRNIYESLFVVILYIIYLWIDFYISTKSKLGSKINFISIVTLEWVVVMMKSLLPFISIFIKAKWQRNIQSK
jgi:glycosyltransferase involved in cell wall biosynthesis